MLSEPLFFICFDAVGITNAIRASIISFEIHNVTEMISFWCRETSTFMKHVVEVAYTYESSFVLGNLPVRGIDPMTFSSRADPVLVRRLCTERIALGRDGRRVTPAAWMQDFRYHPDVECVAWGSWSIGYIS